MRYYIADINKLAEILFMIPQNPEDVAKMFDQIFIKFDNGQQLSIEEEEMLGLYKLRELKDVHKLDDQRFSNYKFRHLYLIYSSDLSFAGKYFKPNFNVRSSEIFDYKKIHDFNQSEFNENHFIQIQNLRRIFDVEIPIENSEIEKDKQYLKNVANEWAAEMLNERHTDHNLALLAKESRDTIRKINIEKFIQGSLSSAEQIDVAKALLKSKYVHIEASKILAKIGKKEVVYKIDGIDVHLTYGTLIHILNRHYAQISSNESVAKSKTFHSPKISPYKLNTILLYIFKKINAKKAMSGLVTADVPIFLKYKGEHYALYLKKDGQNKGKLNINTFYQIDESTAYGKNDMAKIKRGKYIPLSGTWVFIKTSANR